MKILYFGYWGANEGLSQATINPHLELLSTFEVVDQIFFVSIERTKAESFNITKSRKISHHPYFSLHSNRVMAKASDFIKIPIFLKRIVQTNKISLVICRSSLAGSIGYFLHKLTKIPYVVESFEPHADYMKEMGIWPKYGISYVLQKFLEKKQLKTSKRIITVSQRYKDHLISCGMKNTNVSFASCAVDPNVFQFSSEKRAQIRSQLQISADTTVGIYTGKFGGIYWDKKAFELFKMAFDQLSSFFLIILSPHAPQFIADNLKLSGIDSDKVFHSWVSHEEVPNYLSAADFAFSLHKKTKSSIGFSPIKNGEYWANGLPIVASEGIGDDDEIIKKENSGLIIEDLKKFNFRKISQLIEPSRDNSHISSLANKYRNFDQTRKIYSNLILSGIDKPVRKATKV